MSPNPSSPTDQTAERATLELLEEVARVDKVRVATGKVRVETRTDAFEDVAGATLEEVDVEVTRVPRGEVVERAPATRVEGDTTIIPVLEEVLVVEKRLVLKEEIHVRRRVSTRHVEQAVTLRRQTAAITALDAADDTVAGIEGNAAPLR